MDDSDVENGTQILLVTQIILIFRAIEERISREIWRSEQSVESVF